MSSCVLSSSRQEADTADLVIFKDHFTMPTFRLELSTNIREDFTLPGEAPYYGLLLVDACLQRTTDISTMKRLKLGPSTGTVKIL